LNNFKTLFLILLIITSLTFSACSISNVKNNTNKPTDNNINKPSDYNTSKPSDSNTSKPSDNDTSKPADTIKNVNDIVYKNQNWVVGLKIDIETLGISVNHFNSMSANASSSSPAMHLYVKSS